MKPLYLTMKAFGSYAGETAVDFRAFTGGLYLIVGKTGAGKTTIFDAVSYALFGVPSGSERKVEMLHSDFVEKSVDTRVSLTFAHGGREYTVERTIHFPKKRGTAEYGDGLQSALLRQGDAPPVEGPARVTARCEELLGLNAEQFRRIVMLAQGEFREFLRSGSEKKNEILGRLFDNTATLRFQTLLSDTREVLRRQRAGYTAELETVMSAFFLLPPEEAAEPYLPGHPRLLENLDDLARRERAAVSALVAQCEERRQAVEALIARRSAAESGNLLLDRLEENRHRMAELEGRREEMDALGREYEAAERALHRVKPRFDAAAAAADALAAARAEEARLRALLAEQTERQRAAARDAEGDGALLQQAELLSAEVSRLSDALPLYAQQQRQSQELSHTRQELTAREAELSAARDERQELERAAADTAQALKALAGADGEVERRGNELDRAAERLRALQDPEKGVLARVNAVRAGEQALEKDRAQLAVRTAGAREAEERHHALYQAFLAGQAALIGADMARELAETGRAVCPVCGTAFCGRHAFAAPAGDTPNEQAVREAEEAAKAAEERRRTLQSDMERRAALLESRRREAAEAMERIDPACTGWEDLVRTGYLAGAERRLQAERDEADAACAAALAARDRRAALQETAGRQAQEKLRLDDDIRRLTEQRDASATLAAGLEAALSELARHLPCPDEQEARRQLEGLRSRRQALLDTAESHRQALQQAREACSATAGGLESCRTSLPGLAQSEAEADRALRAALDASGFPDAAAYQAALAPAARGGERWLTDRQALLEDYRQQCALTQERVRQLAEQTEGVARADLDQLDENLAAARQARDEADGHRADRERLLENHLAARDRAARARQALQRTESAWRRIDRLAELAVGASGEGGKLSFDRYVMGTIFRQVLDMANRRLDVMTGGRFQLLHSTDAGRKNAVAGLEIDVLDVATGKRRGCGSFSGGESFMVSLALALGLSDVVQSHAGGRRLDTLFIDEGFGSLDDGSLDSVIAVLQQLTEGNRLVGIISHVDKLEESIPQKLRVRSTPAGSTLSLELS